jgi:hypothetical protein
MGDNDFRFVLPVMMPVESTGIGPISTFTQFVLIAPLPQTHDSITSIHWIPSVPSPFGRPSDRDETRPVAVTAGASTPSSAESVMATSSERFLKITIYSADNVPKMDTFSETDPFVVLEFDDRTFRTATLDNAGINPQWREDFVIPLADRSSQQMLLKAALYDEDSVSPSQYIGSVTIDIAQDLLQKTGGGVLDRWYPLTDGQKGRSPPTQHPPPPPSDAIHSGTSNRGRDPLPLPARTDRRGRR